MNRLRWLLLGAFACVLALSLTAQTVPVAAIRSQTPDLGAHQARFAIDGDPASAWQVSGQSAAGLEVDLAWPVWLDSLELVGLPSGSACPTVELWIDQRWLPVAQRLTATDGGLSLDLSGLRVVTDRLALRFPAGPASLAELRVRGRAADAASRPLLSGAVHISGWQLPLAPTNWLTDGELRTIWRSTWPDDNLEWVQTLPGYTDTAAEPWRAIQGTKMAAPADQIGQTDQATPDSRHGWQWQDWTQSAIIVDLLPGNILDSLSLYAPEQPSQPLSVAVETATGWRTMGRLYVGAAGWYDLALGGLTSVRRVRLSADFRSWSSLELAELRLIGRSRLHQGEVRPGTRLGPLSDGAVAYAFPGANRSGQTLELALPASAGNNLTAEFDGLPLRFTQTATVNGVVWYRAQLAPGQQTAALSYLTLHSPLEPLSVWLRADAPPLERPALNGLLGDAWLSTGQAITGQLRLELTTLTADQRLRLLAAPGAWFTLTAETAAGASPLLAETGPHGSLEYSLPAATSAVRLEGQGTVLEAWRLGAERPSTIPYVEILALDATGAWRFGAEFMVAYVSRPDAAIALPGAHLVRQGNYLFGLVGPSAYPTGLFCLQAQVAEGGSGQDYRLVSGGGLSSLRLDQAGQFQTAAPSVRLSGNFNGNYDVWIDGQPVASARGRIAIDLEVPVGYSLHRVELRQRRTGQLMAWRLASVRRYADAPELKVDTLELSWTTATSLVLSGQLAGTAAPATVRVNNRAATLSGDHFSYEVSLSEGPNLVTIEARDSLGRSVSRQVTIVRDQMLPQLSCLYPSPEAMLTGTVAVRVRLTDANPALVLMDGQVAEPNGDEWVCQITRPDGAVSLTVQAWDQAGNTAEPLVVTYLADSTPPEAFSLAFDPAAETNAEQPLVRFATADQTSGLAGYWLSLDGQAFFSVTSPYTFAQPPEGRHSVVVRAIDKAGNIRQAAADLLIDRTPPSRVRYLTATGNLDTIHVSWQAGPDQDLSHYSLTRQPAWSDGQRQQSAIELNDTEVEPGLTYEYTIQPVDRATNIGPAETVRAAAGEALVPVTPDTPASLEFGQARVVMPAGALPDGIVALKACSVQSDELEEAAAFPIVGAIYRFSAMQDDGAGGTVEVEHVEFNKDLLFAIAYGPDDVPAGYDETALAVFYFDQDWNRWVQVENAVVDTANRLVLFQTSHFSYYGLQPTPAAGLSAQEARDRAFPATGSVAAHAGVEVSTQGGTARTSSTEFVLQGRNGYGFPIIREYDTVTARADSERFLLNGYLAYSRMGGSAMLGIAGFFNNNDITELANLVSGFSGPLQRRFAKAYQQTGDFAYSFGIGWRLRLPAITTSNSGVSVRLPSGAEYAVADMTRTAGGNEAADVTERTLRYVYHRDTDFSFVVVQKRSTAILESSLAQAYEIPIWETTMARAILTDGTVIHYNARGAVTKIEEGRGDNTIDFNYTTLDLLDTIQIGLAEGVVNSVKFEYETRNLGFMPLIKNISLSGPRTPTASIRTVSYQYKPTPQSTNLFLPLLVTATDPVGRSWNYDYQSHLLAPAEGGTAGLPLDYLKALGNLAGGTIAATWPRTGTAAAPVARSILYTLNQISGPGVGHVDITTEPQAYNFSTAVLTLMTDKTVLPADSLFRLHTSQVVENSELDGSGDTKTTDYEYTLQTIGDRQCYTSSAIITEDQRRYLITSDYRIFSYAAYDDTTGGQRYLPIETQRDHQRFNDAEWLTYETVKTNYDARLHPSWRERSLATGPTQTSTWYYDANGCLERESSQEASPIEGGGTVSSERITTYTYQTGSRLLELGVQSYPLYRLQTSTITFSSLTPYDLTPPDPSITEYTYHTAGTYLTGLVVNTTRNNRRIEENTYYATLYLDTRSHYLDRTAKQSTRYSYSFGTGLLAAGSLAAVPDAYQVTTTSTGVRLNGTTTGTETLTSNTWYSFLDNAVLQST
ncbi:MAG TPA: hypothetical protein DIV58_01795, partial [Spirochaetaceae bacterium]|nr:hypothetical protein [Spirochaetaceae bacterium]